MDNGFFFDMQVMARISFYTDCAPKRNILCYQQCLYIPKTMPIIMKLVFVKSAHISNKNAEIMLL